MYLVTLITLSGASVFFKQSVIDGLWEILHTTQSVFNILLVGSFMNLLALFIVQSRGVCMAGGVSEGPGDGRVHMGEDGSLMWPVIFFYPEYRQSDFIQAMSETHRWVSIFKAMIALDQKYCLM